MRPSIWAMRGSIPGRTGERTPWAAAGGALAGFAGGGSVGFGDGCRGRRIGWLWGGGRRRRGGLRRCRRRQASGAVGGAGGGCRSSLSWRGKGRRGRWCWQGRRRWPRPLPSERAVGGLTALRDGAAGGQPAAGQQEAGPGRDQGDRHEHQDDRGGPPGRRPPRGWPTAALDCRDGRCARSAGSAAARGPGSCRPGLHEPRQGVSCGRRPRAACP